MQKGIPVISSGGAGMKADFSRLQCNPLAKSTIDPLARALRRELKKRKLKHKSVRIVYSMEKSGVELVPLSHSQKENPEEAQLLAGFRVRIVPVLGTSPALFGIAIAAVVLSELGGRPLHPVVLANVQYLNYTKVHDRFYNSHTNLKKYLAMREKTGAGPGLFDEVFNMADFVFHLRDVFRWTCVSCGKKAVTGADLFIFDAQRELDDCNLVLLCKKCSRRFKKEDCSEFKQSLLPRLEEIWAQVPSLRGQFDPALPIA